ncbi:MAG: histidine phosphatase family protein [Pirellulaceae bacterium]|nr:histidine phosphatase family protein [Pirellulaceae bacterium]
MTSKDTSDPDALTLILMRHAKSDWSDGSLSDHDRPLNARGRRDTPRMANWLDQNDYRPDRILCSTAERTRETVALLCDTWSAEVDVADTQALYLASPDSILRTILDDGNDAKCLMVVAHNPGMTHLASVLADRSVDMPTAAVASFRVSADHWYELNSDTEYQLLDFMRPKGLDQS